MHMKLMGQEREVRPQGLCQGGRTIARDRKTTAFFRAISCKSCDDHMSVWNDALRQPLQIGNPVLRIDKEVKHGTIMPDV